MSRFNKWLDTLIEEKGIDLSEILETRRGEEGRGLPVSFIVEHIKIAPAGEQAKIKDTLVKIDFLNGDICHYLAHLGAALWEIADEYIAVC